jgi:hypothetical protein
MVLAQKNYRNIAPIVAVAAAKASADVINGTVRTLFQNKIFKSQADKIRVETRLAQLSSEQQYALAIRLQNSKNDNERYAILQDAVSQIDVATVESNSEILQAAIQTRQNEVKTTAIIIGAAVVLLLGAYYVIYKRK